MTLAQKYRPTTFEEIVEQDEVKNKLQEEIKNNTLKNAYLFIGQSGQGKTSLARIFANTLNAYTIELDMASHGTAEDMRNLIDTIQYIPIGFSKIVIILDEVQAAMSRKDSMAAQVLLKTLEEPPKHCIFIMCTTEGDKIIDTIKSRCETFIFSPISYEGIYDRLKYICEQEKIKYEINALHRIVKVAKGSMRQAITYLNVINNGTLTEKLANEYFGCGTYDSYFNLLYAICDKDIERIIQSTRYISEPYIQDYFDFIIDVSIYNNTKNINLTDIPVICEKDLKELTTQDKEIIATLRNELLNLQYEGKNSPIIRQLFIATILKIIGA